MQVSVEVDRRSLREVQQAVSVLPLFVAQHVQGLALAAWARKVRAQARRSVPVHRGFLKSSIKVYRRAIRLDGRRIPGAKAVVYAGGVGARHAHLVELGTYRAKANPFLSRSVERGHAAGQAAFVRKVRREVARVAAALASGPDDRKARRFIRLAQREPRNVRELTDG